jgi:hypothetical protein
MSVICRFFCALITVALSVLGSEVKYTIAAIARQESANVAHWLYYHYRLGFDKVFLVSNDCLDYDYQAMLREVAWAPVPPGFVEVADQARCSVLKGRVNVVYRHVVSCLQESWIQAYELNPKLVRTAFLDIDE